MVDYLRTIFFRPSQSKIFRSFRRVEKFDLKGKKKEQSEKKKEKEEKNSTFFRN